MNEEHFKFRLKLGNFEFEVEGNRNYVEKTVARYEGRFLPRFQHLMDAVQQSMTKTASSSETQQINATVPVSGNASVKSEPRAVAKDHKAKRQQRDRPKYPPKRKHSRSSGSTRVKPAPVLPSNQEVTYAPYLPDDVKEESPKPARARKQATISANRGALKEIFDKLDPRTHHEKMLVFAYFLHNRNDYENFTANNVKECYDAVETDPAGNISQVLNHASRTGFLSKSQRGRQVRFSLTSKGKHFVERGLETGD